MGPLFSNKKTNLLKVLPKILQSWNSDFTDKERMWKCSLSSSQKQIHFRRSSLRPAALFLQHGDRGEGQPSAGSCLLNFRGLLGAILRPELGSWCVWGAV